MRDGPWCTAEYSKCAKRKHISSRRNAAEFFFSRARSTFINTNITAVRLHYTRGLLSIRRRRRSVSVFLWAAWLFYEQMSRVRSHQP